ncbi:MAG: substrate-binding domain-containing protein [Alphaproteobacteria bacterium]|nr:substrate-binding domain-containing protein [Alphaproteobacteria bacterium]
MRRTLLAVALLAAPAVAQAQPYQFTYITHGTAGAPFWQTVKNGMDEACAALAVKCQITFLQKTGNLAEELNALNAAIAQHPDGIVMTLPSDTIFTQALQDAVKDGIPIVVTNTNPKKELPGVGVLPYIGQDLEQAGYELARGLSAQFPKTGPIHVLIGVSIPGQNWAEQRAAGVERFVKEYAASNSGRDITFKRLDSGTDLAITGSRVSAYLQGNPQTTAYIDMGYWHAGVAAVLRQDNVPPGKLLMAGFDMVPAALNEMKRGYIQVQVDQQPFLQGYLPIVQLYLRAKYKLGAWDVNTGKALVGPADVDTLLKLSAEGKR